MNSTNEYEKEHGHNTAVTLRLTQPWMGSGRGIYADSLFASVACAEAVKEVGGCWFTGLVKQCSSRFPAVPLKGATGLQRGSSVAMHTTNETGIQLLSCVTCDRNRQQLILTRGRSV